MKQHFLYRISAPNGNHYYGITNDTRKRFAEHRRESRNGSSYPVHAAIRKYGATNMRFEPLICGSRELVAMLEITCIAATIDGYNIQRGGEAHPMLGVTMSEDTRAKMSRAHKGRKQSAEWVAKRTGAQKGAKRSEESRQRMSEGQKKRQRTAEELERMRTIAKGRVVSPEHREKLRVAALARWARARGVIPE